MTIRFESTPAEKPYDQRIFDAIRTAEMNIVYWRALRWRYVRYDAIAWGLALCLVVGAFINGAHDGSLWLAPCIGALAILSRTTSIVRRWPDSANRCQHLEGVWDRQAHDLRFLQSAKRNYPESACEAVLSDCVKKEGRLHNEDLLPIDPKLLKWAQHQINERYKDRVTPPIQA